MKTLDEVIKAFEICASSYCSNHDGDCPYLGHYKCNEEQRNLDALHYLKEYRDKMANDEETYKRGYSCGYAKAKEDEAVSRRWDESYRASQMPWNHGCEMGGKTMKTLDEVIWAVENCDSAIDDCAHCAYYKEDCENLRPLRSDALHYLKEYQRLQIAFLKALADLEDNPPLTWDDLKQMEGKPVWVDGSAFAEGFWTIITGFGKASDTEYVFLLGDQYWKEDMKEADDGVSWQAYRKERK